MAGPIRVLFAIGSMGGGGAERQLIHILRHLDRQRFTPLLYLVHPEGELLSQIPSDVPVISFWDRHEMPRLNFPGRIHRWQVNDFENTIRQFHIDVVYDRTFFMTMITGPACWRCGTPRASVVVCEPQRDLQDSSGAFRGIKRWLLKKAYHQASQVVTVSRALRDEVIAFYDLPPEKVMTLYNFVDVERVDRLAAEPAPEWEPERFHIVTAGRLHEQKGYPYLLDAVRELVNGRNQTSLLLHILGTGHLEEQLRADVRAKRLQWNVCFHGFVENPYPYIRQSHLFCLPSLYEGMPNALLEAMVCRVPVLATDCPTGPREILDDGKFGRLVPPADSAALADAIDHAMKNHEEWQARIAPARLRVEQSFSPQVRIAELENLLIDVASGKKT